MTACIKELQTFEKAQGSPWSLEGNFKHHHVEVSGKESVNSQDGKKTFFLINTKINKHVIYQD